MVNSGRDFKEHIYFQKCLSSRMEEGFGVDSQNAFGASAGSWVSWCAYICCFSFSNLTFSQGISDYFPYRSVFCDWPVSSTCVISRSQRICEFDASVLPLHPRRILLAFSHSDGETLVIKTLSKESFRPFSVYAELFYVEFESDWEIVNSITGFKFHIHQST